MECIDISKLENGDEVIINKKSAYKALMVFINHENSKITYHGKGTRSQELFFNSDVRTSTRLFVKALVNGKSCILNIPRQIEEKYTNETNHQAFIFQKHFILRHGFHKFIEYTNTQIVNLVDTKYVKYPIEFFKSVNMSDLSTRHELLTDEKIDSYLKKYKKDR